MSLLYSTGAIFATGAARYAYRPSSPDDTSPRLVLTVSIAGHVVDAIVDTGAPYVVCEPDLASILGLNHGNDQDDDTLTLEWRGHRIRGRLHRLDVTFKADEGEDLTIDATAFIPDLQPEQVWGDLPSFIGLSGCLERMRFAVDPVAEVFYFGDAATG